MFNPWIDLLFGCGGLFWVMFVVHVVVGYGRYHITQQLPFEGLLMLVASSLLSDSHLAATMMRLYGKKKTRNRLWFHSYLLMALVFPLIAVCLAFPDVLAVLLLVYTAVVIDHTIAQNYGVTLMYCYRSGYIFSEAQKFCLKILHHALAWYAILRILTYKDWIPTQVFNLPVPSLGPLPEMIAMTAGGVLLLSTVTLGVLSIANNQKQKQELPMPAMILLFTSLVMFSSAIDVTIAFYFFIPAFFHAAQYLMINTYYHLKETNSAKPSANQLVGGTTLSYWIKLFALGTAISVLFPMTLTCFGIPYTMSAVAVLVCVSFHHFLADRVLWKFRDSEVSSTLISD